MPTAAQCDARILAQPSLPKARQWLTWVAYHFAELPQGDGWQCGLRDTLLGLHHQIAISARRLRGNPIWDFQGTMTDDTEPLEPGAVRLCGLFEANYPRTPDGRWKNTPDRYQRMMDCFYGALRQQVRLAREIDCMREAGSITVDVMLDQKTVTLTEQ